MNSELEVQVAFLQDVYRQASLDSQRLQAEVRNVREQLEQLQKTIEAKTDSILRQISPRIDQLEQKMRNNWNSIETMDRVAEEELARETLILGQCQQLVQQMEERILQVIHKV